MNNMRASSVTLAVIVEIFPESQRPIEDALMSGVIHFEEAAALRLEWNSPAEFERREKQARDGHNAHQGVINAAEQAAEAARKKEIREADFAEWMRLGQPMSCFQEWLDKNDPTSGVNTAPGKSSSQRQFERENW